jgi:hypothetical protein
LCRKFFGQPNGTKAAPPKQAKLAFSTASTNGAKPKPSTSDDSDVDMEQAVTYENNPGEMASKDDEHDTKELVKSEVPQNGTGIGMLFCSHLRI